MFKPISFSGNVISGNHIGTGLGMPTANILVDKDVSGYEKGVYYSVTEVNGKRYKSISNLGTKPTVKDTDDINLETFIFDFEGDLYGTIITVTLYEFKRPEMKFENLDELKKTVMDDFAKGREKNTYLYL